MVIEWWRWLVAVVDDDRWWWLVMMLIGGDGMVAMAGIDNVVVVGED